MYLATIDWQDNQKCLPIFITARNKVKKALPQANISLRGLPFKLILS